jgi:Tfp pilus assembly protein PilX
MQIQDDARQDGQPTRTTDRKGLALITALFGIVILTVMMSGMHFTATQDFRGTRNALVEQRSFAVAEFGLNSEISNWDRSRNVLTGFPVGSIDANQVYVANGDTSWVKVTRLTENTFWVVSDGRANIGNTKMESAPARASMERTQAGSGQSTPQDSRMASALLRWPSAFQVTAAA